MDKKPRFVEVFEMVPSKDKKAPWKKRSTRLPSGLPRFHCWGTDYDEFESGPGNYTVAIVEYENGEVGSVRAELIKFMEPEK